MISAMLSWFLSPSPIKRQKRPAIVVSSADYNSQRPDLILVAVTSQIRQPAFFGEITVTAWKQAGLIKPSVIKPIFTTIDKGLVLKKLGQLQQDDRRAIQHILRSVLG